MVDVQKLTSDLQALKRAMAGVTQGQSFDEASVSAWIQSKNMLRVNINRAQQSHYIFKLFSMVVFRSESRFQEVKKNIQAVFVVYPDEISQILKSEGEERPFEEVLE